MKTPATTKKVVIPAEYKTMKVRKQVQAASERRIDIPAEFQTVSKRVKVADAIRSWRLQGEEGAGNATGRRLCVAEIPARTKVVTRRVEKTPATSRREEIPAAYKTVKVRKLVAPASERRIDIPAEYQTVTRRKLVRDGQMEWRSILCETNASPQLVMNLQRALDEAGHDPGPIDGRIGNQTLSAVRAFQSTKGLPTGGVTIATLEALGVRAER